MALAVALAGAVVAAAACDLEPGGEESRDGAAGEDGDGENAFEDLGEAEDAIQGGAFDTEFEAEFPGSVMLRDPVAGISCSGTLITPRWVLTAAHCMEHGVDRDLHPWEVYVSNRGSSGGTSISISDRTFAHTGGVRHRIPTFDGPTEPFELRDSDMAVVYLDRRVPHPIGLSATLPEQSECGSSFNGKLVGFSSDGFDELGYNCASEQGEVNYRRRSSPDWLVWNRYLEDEGAVYTHWFYASAGQGCVEMEGIGTNGDSGGSLYKLVGGNSSPLLCGVISGDGPDNLEGLHHDGSKRDQGGRPHEPRWGRSAVDCGHRGIPILRL